MVMKYLLALVLLAVMFAMLWRSNGRKPRDLVEDGVNPAWFGPPAEVWYNVGDVVSSEEGR
jgi:hypothetical protein